MSYCIDGETLYWGGLKTLNKGYERNLSMYHLCGRIPPSFDVKEWDKVHGKDLKSVTDGVVDYISEEMARALAETFEESRKACKEWDELANKLRNKLEQMEKKVNKMTRAEAFEWLKNKKVYVGGHSDSIQATLFEAGFKWPFSHHDIQHLSQPFLFIHEKGEITYDNDMLSYREHRYEEIKADDILSIEIVEEKKEKFVDCSKPCDEIKAVQELLRNSKYLKDKTLVITKDNAAIL